MNKFKLARAQWYISHTCNLACKNCLSFNNFALKGQEPWTENEEHVKRWSELVEVDDLSIIGGEPMTNPDLDLWVKGVRQYFDTKDFKICSNGTQLNRWKDHLQSWFDQGVIIEIHTHNKNHLSDTWKALTDLSAVTWIKGEDFEHKYYNTYDWVGIQNSNVVVLQTNSYQFVQWGTKGKNTKGEYELFESNAKLTHSLCPWNNCHYWYRGELYKCGTIVGAQKFVNTYPVVQAHKDKIMEYRGISYNSNNLEEQIADLRKTIPQCGLCPTASKNKYNIEANATKEKF